MRAKDKSYEEPESIITKFYYIRQTDEQKFPVVSVCLKYNPPMEEVSRGMAICDMEAECEQKRSRRGGRNIAETRAVYAMNNKCKHLEIKKVNRFDPEVQRFLCVNNISWMCEYLPDLTTQEEDILGLSNFGPIINKLPKIQVVNESLIDRIKGVIKAIRQYI